MRARPRLRDRESEGRRRQDDDRREPRRLPRRGRRALPARSTSTHRRTRRRASAAARTASRPTIFSTASRSASSPSRRRSRTSTSFRPSRSSRPRPSSSPALEGGERYLAEALVRAATDAYSFVFLDCPPCLRAADGQRARGRRPGDRPGAGRVLRARRPLAAARLDQPRQGAAQPAPRRRRDPADDGRRPHPSRGRGRAGAAPPLRRARLHAPPCRARCGSPRRRATGCPQSPTTAARPARRPTGRWRWSLSSVNDTPRRGLGRGLEVLIGGAGEAELLHLPVEVGPPEPAPAAPPLRARGDLRARGVDPPSGRAPAGRRAPAARGRLRARSPASGAGAPPGRPACRRSRRSSATPTTATRSCSASSRTSPARISRRSRRRAPTRR